MKFFTPFEIILWLSSSAVVILSAMTAGEPDIVSLSASLIGVTALIFIAKGHYLGQLLTIVFAVLYGIVSVSRCYYGEAFTYLGMTAPSAAAALISWIRHPYKDSKEVEVSNLGKKKVLLILLFTALVTTAFYFLLKALNTAQLIVSTLSVATSFGASMLMFFRSPYYAVIYACNDIVLIVLWNIACAENLSYLPMVACFTMFFLNDIYGFVNWRRMKNRQKEKSDE